jgi:hypothetical protein
VKQIMPKSMVQKKVMIRVEKAPKKRKQNR